MKEFNTPRPLRLIYYILGCVMVALGIIGAFLPIMPTVPFLLVAAWCFARSSPRFHHWLHNHPTFGPPIRQWQEKGAISPLAKCWAVGGMICGYGVFLGMSFYFDYFIWWLAIVIAAILLSISVFILTRPSA